MALTHPSLSSTTEPLNSLIIEPTQHDFIIGNPVCVPVCIRSGLVERMVPAKYVLRLNWFIFTSRNASGIDVNTRIK